MKRVKNALIAYMERDSHHYSVDTYEQVKSSFGDGWIVSADKGTKDVHVHGWGPFGIAIEGGLWENVQEVRGIFQSDLSMWVEPSVVVTVESFQLISEPDLIQPLVDLNPGNVIKATRYYMWQSPNGEMLYRTDGYYAPRLVPLAIPSLRYALSGWHSLDTYPTVYEVPNVTNEALNIQDYRFVESPPDDPTTPVLREYPGVVRA